ncbi:M1 family metallopeptidase [Flammeovirga kamogawensis]|uniref:Aminopeptidase N n=1 Tax=Flammeovirga kamogawensis TaxID=373891 RepID=A0ABX8GRP0_9BACT|nr:M1 family metallopeptidase [Flammeovirga kamogawensis]MBB6461334.1 aminopeptidase N [Flammeovirga kamogawensis]QWG06240.1 M1 family metallopeptidase [Flammeovirga kamogawensis]TRX68071.1 M1 family metallopeptidase [Flammeovirga kamogawensis]
MISNYKHAIFCALLLSSSLNACKTVKPAAADQAAIETPDTPITPEILPEEDTTQPEWISKGGPYQAAYDRSFNLLHTQLKVSFDWEKQHMSGDAILTLQPHFYSQKDVILDAKNFDIHKVELVDKNQKVLKSLDYTYDSIQITIALDKSYSRNDVCSIHISYTAKPNERESHGSEAITSDKGLYFINPLGDEIGKPQQIWTQGETAANSCWFPTFDHPNVKMKQDVFITVQNKYVTLSNGKLVSQQKNSDGTRTDHWKQELPHSVYLTMMTVGDFAIVKDEWRGKEVSYYVEPAFEKYARTIFGNTPEMLEFFSERFNYDYPWAKYSQVIIRDFVSGAMENTTASTFMESVQVDDREKLDQDWDFIVAHELFHHWFGDLVTSESWSNLPLNESWANYSEYLWREHKISKDEADYALQSELDSYLAESETKQEPLIRYHYQNKEDMFDSHSYAKGGYTLNLLRHTIGDDAFFQGASLYLKENAFKAAEIAHLRLAFEEVTGQDLNWFFNQWFMEAGHPDLFIKDSFSNGKVKLLVQQRQDPEYTPIYKIPTTVEFWWNDGHSEQRQITVKEASETFSFAFAEKPSLIIFDTEHIIPAVITHSKNTEAYLQQANVATNIMHRVEAILQLGDMITADPSLIAKLNTYLKDPFWGIRETTATIFDGYKGTGDLNPTIAILRDLVKNDPKSTVRATALSTLSSIDENFLPTAQQALNDSSYMVIATSLYATSAIEGPSIVPTLEKFADARNPNIVFVSSMIYAELGTEGKLPWYDAKLAEMNDQYRQYMFRTMTGYILSLQNEEEKEKAVDIVLKYAQNRGSSTQTKIAAYQALSPLLEDETLKGKIEEALNKETDKDVIDALKQQGY